MFLVATLTLETRLSQNIHFFPGRIKTWPTWFEAVKPRPASTCQRSTSAGSLRHDGLTPHALSVCPRWIHGQEQSPQLLQEWAPSDNHPAGLRASTAALASRKRSSPSLVVAGNWWLQKRSQILSRYSTDFQANTLQRELKLSFGICLLFVFLCLHLFLFVWAYVFTMSIEWSVDC